MTRDEQRMHKARRKCEAWNAKHVVGTPVRYFTDLGRDAPSVETRTKTEAYILHGHTAVVCVAGQLGCVALDHVLPIGLPAESAA